ncbi:hypothetical protein PIB30_068296 [Stylosanthes scabra]|uniref:Uncharacterized protein n=1 Tax=Stylosanthes scabra TaxID=79078 RepID=A0ABU6VMN6_9FABA|nr:hypothetical protein [Stylosanthes scabra]
MNLGDVFQFCEFESKGRIIEDNRDKRAGFVEGIQGKVTVVEEFGEILKALTMSKRGITVVGTTELGKKRQSKFECALFVWYIGLKLSNDKVEAMKFYSVL